jgi:hypothetical protein
MNQYISRGIDYRGHLASRLRDLEGFDTLAYELIQNADDAEGVSKISFDITDKALIVENDGKFSDCGQGGEQQECSWKGEKGYMCDFHRFRMVSSEDKRCQEDTTGAFGVGFSVVYQITDQPELISSGRHWIIREWEEENRRIEVCPGCGQCQDPDLPGTRFIFPWAFDQDSKLRRSLNLTAVDDSKINNLFNELDARLPIAILFLRRIKRIDLKRNGKIHKSIERLEEGQSLIICYGQSEVVWYLFKEKFDAQKLRNKYQDKIESKRSSEVTIAIPEDPLKSGLLCSTLPTRHESGLPFHINADFFTTSNRKDVIFDGGYQAEWNIAAIQKAASMIAEKLDDLASSVGHRSFWSLIASIKEVDESPFKVFWDEIKKRLPNSKTVYTLQGEWAYPKEAFLLSRKEDYNAASVLQGLGLRIVHDDLEPYRELLKEEAKVGLLSVQEIIRALEKLGLKDRDEKVKGTKIPQFLREPKNLEYLWKIIGHVLKNEPKGGNIRNELAKCSIALTRDSSLHRCDWVYYDNRDDVELFEKLCMKLDFLADEAKGWDEIKNLCRKLDANTVIIELRKLTFNEWQPELESLLKWFERNGEVLKDEKLKESLSQLPIFPAHQGGLRPLDRLVLPGGFEDPLGVTDSIDVSKIQEVKDFLQKLGLQQLSLEKYITEHLPQAFQSAPPLESIKKVIEILVKNFENIKDSENAKGALRRLPIIECDDGKFYKPEEAYFPEILVEVIDLRRARISKDENRELYKWLGVNERLRVQDLIDGIRKLTSESPTVESKRKVQAVWEYLSKELNNYKQDDKDRIKERLSSLRWLPAQGIDHKWLAPDEIYSTLRRNLFYRSQAKFLDIPDEKQSENLLKFLGVKIEPEVKLVVEHLLNSAKGQEEVDNAVYNFLNEHADDSEIQTLKCEPCLLIKVESQKKYFRPNEVFWKEHSLKPFRYTLDQSWEGYKKLLRRLELREEPDHEDAIAVLQEIAREYGETNLKLDDKAYAVVNACWSMIAKALKDNKSIELRSLSDRKVVPDKQRLLKPPSWMYIKDRADLADKFEALEHNSIERIEDVWLAWRAAGAKMLSEWVRSEVQTGELLKDEIVLQRLQDRQLELKRVLDSFGNYTFERDIEKLLQVKFYRTDELQVRYRLDNHETNYEETNAHFQKENNELYYVLKNGELPWPEIARELVQAICPDKPGLLASGFYEVLAVPTREEAKNKLDTLGYRALEAKLTHEGVSHEPARLGASSSPKFDKELEEPQMIEETAGGEVIDRTIPSPIEAETKLEDKPSQFSKPMEQPRSIPRLTTPQPTQGRRRDQSRFPVYVSHQDESEGRETKGYATRDQEAIEKIEEMAIERVMQYEKKEGRSPERKPRNYPGYDIESRDASGNIRYIEVKGLADDWGTRGIALTDKQFQTAQEKKDQYWLYIVERATQENYKIYRIHDPANKVNQFFYDDSWKQVAEVIEEAQQN